MSKHILLVASAFFLLFSCSTSKQTATYWVGSSRADCVGVSKMKCLQIHKGENLSNANWENFYSSIDGFEFEEGYLQKIEVEERKLNPKDVPADGSSIEYKLVKVLEKQKDERAMFEGEWVATSMRGKKVGAMDQLPTMQIDRGEMRISGSSSCNQYFGTITKLSETTVNFGRIGSTKRMCQDMSTESAFISALSEVAQFERKNGELVLSNSSGEQLISFRRAASEKTMQALHDIWTAIRVNGNPINRMVKIPNLEINLNQMRIMGNDGCNEYSADIQYVSEDELSIGAVASTRKACKEENIAPPYYKALDQVKSYRRDGLNLILMNEKGKEVLAFMKVD